MRRLLWLLLPLAMAWLLMWTVVWSAPWWSGRSSAEVLGHLDHRMANAPELAWMRPALHTLGTGWLQRRIDLPPPPFQVPRPPANPATAQSPKLATPESLAASPPARSAEPAGHPAVPDGWTVLQVGPGRQYATIATAASAARERTVIEIDPGDYLADVTAWEQSDLIIRGMGPRVRMLAAGAHAEGKAIWVTRGRNVTIEHIDFIGAQVPDGNGAGVRLESGDLTVRDCLFHGNQTGLLASDDPNARLTVEDSRFGYNGTGDGLTHNLYAGSIAELTVRGSYFHHANVGHLLKSRARVSRILHSRFSDESGGRASYELEFPNGGDVVVWGNVVQQDAGTQNSTIIAFGAEGLMASRQRLWLVHNTIVNDLPRAGIGLRVAPGVPEVLLRNNVWVGPHRQASDSPVDAAGEVQLDWPDLLRPSRYDYRLQPGTARLALAPLPAAEDAAWPLTDYRHPAGTRQRSQPPSLPGALQPGGSD